MKLEVGTHPPSRRRIGKGGGVEVTILKRDWCIFKCVVGGLTEGRDEDRDGGRAGRRDGGFPLSGAENRDWMSRSSLTCLDSRKF